MSFNTFLKQFEQGVSDVITGFFDTLKSPAAKFPENGSEVAKKEEKYISNDQIKRDYANPIF